MRGFTLVELLIVIGITGILVAASIPIYGSLQTRAQLRETSAQVVDTLRTAEVRARSGLNNSNHGVFFDINSGTTHTYTMYQGDSYSLRTSNYDRTIKLESILGFQNIDMILTGVDIDINYTNNTGKTNNVGSFRIIHGVEGVKTININSFGKIDEN